MLGYTNQANLNKGKFMDNLGCLMLSFIVKCVVVTCCFSIACCVFFSLMPTSQRYEYIDKDTKFDTYTGQLKIYSTWTNSWCEK